MKIYTRIEIDMRTDAVLHEESFEYEGGLALCGGGGGTDTVDEEYNARMATIAESQEDKADEMFNFYKYGSLEGPSKEYNVGGQWLSESDAQDYLYSQQGGNAPAQAGEDFSTWLNRSAESVKRPQGQPGGRGGSRGSGFKSTSNEYLIDGQWMSYNQAQDYYQNGPAAGTVDLGGYDTRTTGDSGQTSYLDLEKMKIDANAEMIPLQTGMEKAKIGAVMDSSIWGGGENSGGGAGLSPMPRRGLGGGGAAGLQTSGDPNAVVESHYQNLFGRAPQEEGLNFWQGQLESGAVDEGELKQRMLDAASESDMQLYEDRPSDGYGLKGAGGGQQTSGENQFTQEARLRKAQIGLGRDVIGSQRQMLPQVQSLVSGYLSDADDGLDVQEQMGAAQTDVSAAYQGSSGALRRQASRLGLNPKSGKFADAASEMNMNRARDIAGARTRERRATEQENFRRKSQASQLGLGIFR